MTANERARQLVAEWKQDCRNGVPVPEGVMLECLIAQALEDVRNEALEEAAEMASRLRFEEWTGPLAPEIRALKRKERG